MKETYLEGTARMWYIMVNGIRREKRVMNSHGAITTPEGLRNTILHGNYRTKKNVPFYFNLHQHEHLLYLFQRGCIWNHAKIIELSNHPTHDLRI